MKGRCPPWAGPVHRGREAGFFSLERFPTPLAGVDEAGRGCLAGPVVAAAVILPDTYALPGLTDSKKLSPLRRQELFSAIRSTSLAWALGLSWPPEIDRINILQATLTAMKRAVNHLKLHPAFVLIDGNASPGFSVPSRSIPKADLLVPAVSAASILAKTYRDRLMHGLDKKYPAYGLKVHKGYATSEHVLKLRTHGPCPLHRKSFRPVRELLRLEKQGCLPGI